MKSSTVFVRQRAFASLLFLFFTLAAWAQPVINSFSPSSGPVGTLLTIHGRGLLNPTAVLVGGVPAVVVSNNGVTLRVLVMPGAGNGAVQVSTVSGNASQGTFTLVASKGVGMQQGGKLHPGSSGSSSNFGYSIALSADGQTAVVGAPTANIWGGVWVFTRSGTLWTQQGGLLSGSGKLPNNFMPFTQFMGFSVAISADGNTILFGGYMDNSGKGAAWVFVRNGTTWSQQGIKILPAGGIPAYLTYFGRSVALSADGNTALIGAPGDNNNNGAIWVFTRSGGVWSQQGNKLTGTAGVDGNLGESVSLSADGNTALAGAPGYHEGALVFVRQGGTWARQGGRLAGTGATGQAKQGKSVSLSADGNTALIGGPDDDNNKGAVWVFKRNGSSWAQQGAKLTVPGALGLGSSTTVNAEGTIAVFGGPYSQNNEGGAWSFRLRSGNWRQWGVTLQGTGTTGAADQGQGVAISADGNTLFVGGYLNELQRRDEWSAAHGAAWAFTASNVSALSGLSVNGSAVAPAFQASQTAYTATVSMGASFVRMIASGSSGTERITINGIETESGELSPQIPLQPGVNTLTVVVTSQDGTTSRTYTVTVNRAPPTITSVVPASGTVGSLVTISGTNLELPSVLNIGGVPAMPVSGNGQTLVALVMPGTTGGAVTVGVPGSSVTSSTSFTVVSPRAISAQQGVKMTATGASGAARLGFATALSADGNTALAGGYSNDGNKGAVWMYTRSNGVWNQQGSRLTVLDMVGAGKLGYSAALSADGNTALVGAPADNNEAGAAWVFVREGGVWTQQGTKLAPSGGIGAAQAGLSVALSADGNTALLGAPYDNGGRGATWVFVRTGTTWTQQGKLLGAGNIGDALQGTSVALSADGHTAFVGATHDNNGTGAAWVFTRSGSTWSQQGNKLVGTDGVGTTNQGYSVALSADGHTAIMGSWIDNTFDGAAWVFVRNGGSWSQQGGKLTGTGATVFAQRGWSVSLSADGNRALIGGPGDEAERGAWWLFTRSGGTWSQSGTKLSGNGNAGNSLQGSSVRLSYDGGTVVAGGPGDNNNAGALWFFAGSSDATLSNLEPGTGSLTPTFSPATTSYTLAVSPSVTSLTLTPTMQHVAATVTVQGIDVPSGTASAPVALSAGTNNISVVVTAEDGSTRTYTVVVQRSLPEITSIHPASGPVGTLVMLTGTGLTLPSLVTIGGVSAIPISATGTSLVAMVMPGAITGAVSVNVSGAIGNGSANFTVVPSKGIGMQQGNKLVDTGSTGQANYGYSVALSADGNTAIVGALTDDGGAGASFVYTRSNGIWRQQGPKLVGSGAVGNASQGWSVALSADGNTALVGGPGDDGSKGAVWVFTRNAGVWSQQGSKLVANGAVAYTAFGFALALSADGNTMLAGSNHYNSAQQGAWVFVRHAGVWSQQGGQLAGTGAVGTSYQGSAVALSADGHTALLGAPSDDNYRGATWVFVRTGTTWSQQGSKLVGTGAEGSASQGRSVALNANGNTALIGGGGDNGGNGAAWGFTRNGSTWAQQGSKLLANGTAFAGVGVSVALSADGNLALAGGNFGEGAWLFKRIGGTWMQQPGMLSGSDLAGPSNLGIAAALSADGNTALLGGNKDDNDKGAAWMYVASNNANLSALVPGAGSLTPAFDPAVTSYVLATTGADYKLTFTPTAQNPTSGIKVNGVTVATGTASSDIYFNVGDSIIPIEVTAQDGTVRVYTVTVSRAGPVITSLSPLSGPVGSLVTITGSNLIAAPMATLVGTVLATPVSNDGQNLVAMVMPEAASGPARVYLMGAGATATSSSTFNVVASKGVGMQQGPKLSGTGGIGKSAQGVAVALSADGQTAVVAGLHDDSYTGALWFYRRNNGVWTQQGAKMVGSGAVGSSYMGWSVAISADGNTVIAGGPIQFGMMGSAWVFVRNGNTWTQQGPALTPTDNTGAAGFGTSVALRADGNTAAIGGQFDDGWKGAAWVFTRSGGVWTQQGNKLVGTGATGLMEQGESVALDATGSYLAVGGSRADNETGAAWIFRRNGNAWAQQGGKLVGTGAIGASHQGRSVRLSADARTLLVGAPGDDQTGTAWVFVRDWNTWTQQGDKLALSLPAGGQAYAGHSVSLSADGNRAAIGAYGAVSGEGGVYLFTRSGTTWSRQAGMLQGSDATQPAAQGVSVALSADGNTLLSGGPADNDTSGSVWVFVASNDATLSNLVANKGTFAPQFHKDSLSYTIYLPLSATDITLTPTASNPTSSITVNGVAVSSGMASAAIPITPGSNTLSVVVTAQDGTIRTYTVTVIRGVPITLRYPGAPYCTSSGQYQPEVTPAFTGTYSSSPAGLHINSTTGIIDVAASQAGIYTVTLDIGGQPVSTQVAIRPTQFFNSTTNQFVCAGSTLSGFNFGSIPGVTYAWSNTNSTIGIAPSGTGNLGAFTTVNNGTIDQTALITVRATGGTGCAVTPLVFGLTVAPLPQLNSISDQTVCAGQATTPVNFSNAAGSVWGNWTNDNPGIGTAASATNSPGIGVFNARNPTGDASTVATFTVTPVRRGCSGTPVQFTITVRNSATSLSYPQSTYCQNTGALPILRAGAGGTFSATPTGLTIDANTGRLNFWTSLAGTYTVTYTLTGVSGCNSSASTQVTVLPRATLSIWPAGPISVCRGEVVPPIYFFDTSAQYSWTNSNTAIGLAASGTGNVPSFVAQNPTTSMLRSTILVTAIGNGTTTCNSQPTPIYVGVSNCNAATVTQAGGTGGDASTLRTQDVTLSPVPARDRVTVQLTTNEYTSRETYTVQLVSQYGGAISKPAVMNTNPYTVDLSGLTPGVYTVRITSVRTGQSVQKQVVKM